MTRCLMLVCLLVLTFAARAQESMFEGLEDQVPPTPGQVDAAALWIADRLSGATGGAPPAEIADDLAPRVVYLSLSDGASPARIITARGAGLPAAIDAAIARAPAMEIQWLRLDVIDSIQAARPMLRELPDPRRWGVVLDGQIGLLPDELLLRQLLAENRLISDRVRPYLSTQTERVSDAAALSLTPTHLFTTLSALVEDGEPVQITRTFRSFPSVSDEQVQESIDLSGRYVIGSVRENGQFLYLYNAGLDESVDDYNILRHAGTLWSMADLYEVTQDPSLRLATSDAMMYLLLQLRPAPGDPEALVVVWNGESSLGGNALAALALARWVEVSGDRTQLDKAQKLGRSLIAAQSASGKFVTQRQEYPSGRRFALDALYYPGQAILALVQLYRADQDPQWLDAAEKAANYLIAVQSNVPPETIEHDQWNMYAFAALDRERPQPKLLDQAMLMARRIMASQLAGVGPYESDWLGAWDGGRSTPAATRAEGLLAVALRLREVGREAEARRLIDSAERSIQFQLKTQIRPEQAMFLPNPPQALGGFREALLEPVIRIDYVQHNLTSLLLLQQARK